MTNNQFGIKELIEDLRNGADDEQIREKYRLAQDILEQIKEALVRRKLLPNRERKSPQAHCLTEPSANSQEINSR